MDLLRTRAISWLAATVVLAALLLVGLASCRFGPKPTEPASAPLAPGSFQAFPAAPRSVPQAPEDRATVLIHIRWPDRAFRAATIPLSTSALHIRIASSDGDTLAEKLVVRQPGDATVSVAIDLRAASNASVEVKAYRESDPTIGVSTPIAQGTAAGQNFGRSQVTVVSIGLSEMFAPTIARFSANVGKDGDTITLFGANLGVLDGSTPSVVFDGQFASVSAQVTPLDAGTLRVKIPAGAAVGRVVVVNDGIPSTSLAIFWPILALSISAPKASWDPSPSSARMAYYGSTLQFSATPVWRLPSGAQASRFGTPPGQTWSSTNTAGSDNTISSGGLLLVGRDNARPTDVAATIGSLTSAAIRVTPVGVDAIAVTPASVTLNASPISGTPAPGFVVSALLTASVSSTLPYPEKLTWESSDVSRATVNASGSVTAVANAAPGSVVISVKALDDESKQASASVAVTRRGDLQLVVD